MMNSSVLAQVREISPLFPLVGIVVPLALQKINYRRKKSVLRNDITVNLLLIQELKRAYPPRNYNALISKSQQDIDSDSAKLLKVRPISWSSAGLISLEGIALIVFPILIFHGKDAKTSLLLLSVTIAGITTGTAVIATGIAIYQFNKSHTSQNLQKGLFAKWKLLANTTLP